MEPSIALKQIVKARGVSVYQNALLVEALLRDHCPEDRAGVHCVMNALREGIPEAILRAGAEGNRDSLRGALSERLRDAFAMADTRAAWAVDAWIAALTNGAPPPAAPPDLPRGPAGGAAEPRRQQAPPQRPPAAPRAAPRQEPPRKQEPPAAPRMAARPKLPPLKDVLRGLSLGKKGQPLPPLPAAGSAQEIALFNRAAEEILQNRAGQAVKEANRALHAHKYKRDEKGIAQLTAMGVPERSACALTGHFLQSEAFQPMGALILVAFFTMTGAFGSADAGIGLMVFLAIPLFLWSMYRYKRAQRIIKRARNASPRPVS